MKGIRGIFAVALILMIIATSMAEVSPASAYGPVVQGGTGGPVSIQDVGVLPQDLAPQPTPSAGGGGMYITSITLARGVQGQDNTPVNPTATFSPSDTFHAVAAILNAPANTNFTSIWYAVDVGSAAPPNTVIDSAQVLTDGTRNIDFSLMPPTSNSWPVGAYSVEIDVNGVKSAQMFFSVQ
jgi:hypothetical protein